MITVALYLRERVRIAVFVPAIALLTGLALWAAAPADLLPAAMRAVTVIAIVVLQFRVWDDLEDRDADTRAHPERVLARLPAGPIRALAWVLGVAGVVALAVQGAWASTASLAALDLSFWTAYRHVRPLVPARVWQYQILLLKYPALVAIGALACRPSPAPGRMLSAGLLAYAGAVAYERLHNRRGVALGATP